jgi:Eisosome protein 1
MSLKYARAQDLPSFPSVGINRGMSAGAAANLAHSSPKVAAWPKPSTSADAEKAAMLAKDYKMDPPWQPEASAAGSKAAILAHKNQGRDWWQAQSSKDSNAAAGIAMRMKLSPDVNYGVTEDGHRKALMAATLSVRGRKRSGSTPDPVESYPDASKSVYNAHNAATVADANRYGSRAMEASRVTHLGEHVTPKMFTEHPPIAWEVEDKKHDDALKASAISMAKKMYAMQQVDDDGNITIRTDRSAAVTSHNRAPSGADPDIKQQAMQYLSLQDAAQRLAAERLAKIQHPDESAAFRNYYGYPSRKARSRLSVRGRNRDRASSEGAPQVESRHDGSRFDYDSDDEEQARKIRSRQSQFNGRLAAVDKKREQDRKALLSAAEKKVHAQMHKLDQKVFDDTGKMSPQMIEEWDAKARARAAANSEARMQNHGKVSIGGGKFIDQSEINAIARARIQPTLDQINDKAEKQRARDEEVRLDADEKKRLAHEQKQREAELKAEQKRARSKPQFPLLASLIVAFYCARFPP